MLVAELTDILCRVIGLCSLSCMVGPLWEGEGWLLVGGYPLPVLATLFHLHWQLGWLGLTAAHERRRWKQIVPIRSSPPGVCVLGFTPAATHA